MQKETFGLCFRGPALDQGSIDVRDLAPSLLAICDLIQEAGHVVYGEKAAITIKVQGDFKTSSFEVLLEIAHFFTDTISNLLSFEEQYNIKQLLLDLGIFSAMGLGYFKIKKWLKGKKVDKEEDTSSGEKKIYFGNESRTINQNVYKLIINSTINQSADKLMVPLRNSGIDSIGFSAAGETTELINSNEADYFRYSGYDDATTRESRRTDFFSLAAPTSDQSKWQLMDDGSKIMAKLCDHDFERKWKCRNVLFGYGDILELELLTVSKITGKRIIKEHFIINIINHIPGPSQEEMDIEGAMNDEQKGKK